MIHVCSTERERAQTVHRGGWQCFYCFQFLPKRQNLERPRQVDSRDTSNKLNPNQLRDADTFIEKCVENNGRSGKLNVFYSTALDRVTYDWVT